MPLPAVEGLMYLAPACTFWLLIGSLALEWQRMRAGGALAVVLQRPGAFAAAAAMGFAVNLLSYFVIQVCSFWGLLMVGMLLSVCDALGRKIAALDCLASSTHLPTHLPNPLAQTASSLTLKVLGTVKSALVVLLGVVLLQETVTPLQARRVPHLRLSLPGSAVEKTSPIVALRQASTDSVSVPPIPNNPQPLVCRHGATASAWPPSFGINGWSSGAWLGGSSPRAPASLSLMAARQPTAAPAAATALRPGS